MNYKEKIKYFPKPLFVERMKKLIPDYETFFEISYTETPDSIRCNTLKIKPEELKNKLERKGWKIKQPFKEFPEIMIVESRLKPGELGNAKEHLLGYFYVQEISSMLPMLALMPKPGDMILDLCASPGSKTTQAASMMENKGTIIANDNDLNRIAILSANLEKCGVMNAIVTRRDGVQLCETLAQKSNFRFDKILVDAPCSGEGTLRKSPKTFLMWNINMIKKFSRVQKKLAGSALKLLKPGGEMVYSTCTLTPEEDESVADFLAKNFDVTIQKINLPLKTREGIKSWEGKEFDENIKFGCRIYPQDNNTDGFFLVKVKKNTA
ncbi:MAG: NOL1/NOP2/sun family putative RNA methylase [Nanoarchaeota archaeon]